MRLIVAFGWEWTGYSRFCREKSEKDEDDLLFLELYLRNSLPQNSRNFGRWLWASPLLSTCKHKWSHDRRGLQTCGTLEQPLAKGLKILWVL